MLNMRIFGIMTPDALQKFAKKKFEDHFKENVFCGKNAEFRIDRGVYSPEPDVAVGPFAIVGKLIDKYDEMATASRLFIEECIQTHIKNLSEYRIDLPKPNFDYFCGHTAINENARCFIAAEIEKSPPSLKHILGSTINAVALGRVGLLIGFSNDKVEQFLRCLKYLNFLKSVGKPSIEFGNGLILSKNQFIEILKTL